MCTLSSVTVSGQYKYRTSLKWSPILYREAPVCSSRMPWNVLSYFFQMVLESWLHNCKVKCRVGSTCFVLFIVIYRCLWGVESPCLDETTFTLLGRSKSHTRIVLSHFLPNLSLLQISWQELLTQGGATVLFTTGFHIEFICNIPLVLKFLFLDLEQPNLAKLFFRWISKILCFLFFKFLLRKKNPHWGPL